MNDDYSSLYNSLTLWQNRIKELEAQLEEMGDYVFPFLDEESYEKAIGQFRLGVGSYLSVFDCHGMGAYIKPVSEAIVELAHDFGMRIRGEDRPIDSKVPRLPRPTE